MTGLFNATAPIWVEPFAGSLAVGMCLLGHRRPLTGYMGSKYSYRTPITRELGIIAAREIWCADVTGWATCYRALSVSGAPMKAARELQAIRDSVTERTPRAVRRVWMELRDEWGDGMAPTPRAAAVWVGLVRGSALQRGPNAGCQYTDDSTPPPMHKGNPLWRGNLGCPSRLAALGDRLPVRVWDDAADIPTAPGAYVLIDPPYAGTTGYSKPYPGRSHWRPIVDRWRDAGAVVGLTETSGEPDADKVVDMTAERRGTTRNKASNAEILSVWEAR